MRSQIYEKIVFMNASGNQVIIVDKSINNRWEMIGRTGFTAPEVELITETYANGVTKTLQRIVSPRTCTITILAIGKTPEQLDTEFGEMISILMDITKGIEGKLYITRPDGSVLYLNCVYSGGANVKEEYRLFRRFTLSFYASDPYFYRDIDDVFIDIPPKARLTLRNRLMLGTGHVLGENMGRGEQLVINNGQETIQPIIRVNSLKGTLAIWNDANGDRIVFNEVVIGREKTLVIDTRDINKTIYIEDSDGSMSPAGQYLNWSNIEFDFALIPGENSIKFQTEDLSASKGLTLQLSERYLSA